MWKKNSQNSERGKDMILLKANDILFSEFWWIFLSYNVIQRNCVKSPLFSFLGLHHSLCTMTFHSLETELPRLRVHSSVLFCLSSHVSIVNQGILFRSVVSLLFLIVMCSSVNNSSNNDNSNNNNNNTVVIIVKIYQFFATDLQSKMVAIQYDSVIQTSVGQSST